MVQHQNPEHILQLWQRTHQKLSDEMQDRFLARKELDDICRYSVTSVKEAVEKHKKLKDILSELRQTEVIVVKDLPAGRLRLEKMPSVWVSSSKLPSGDRQGRARSPQFAVQ